MRWLADIPVKPRLVVTHVLVGMMPLLIVATVMIWLSEREFYRDEREQFSGLCELALKSMLAEETPLTDEAGTQKLSPLEKQVLEDLLSQLNHQGRNVVLAYGVFPRGAPVELESLSWKYFTPDFLSSGKDFFVNSDKVVNDSRLDTTRGQSVLYLRKSLTGPMEQLVLLIRVELTTTIRKINRLSTYTLYVLFSTLVIIIIFALQVAQTISAPIYGLIRVAKEIAAGDYHGYLPSEQNDEIGDLVAKFKLVQEQLEYKKQMEQQILQADKMISLGIMAAGVAHEINNPAHFIQTHLEPVRKCWDGAVPILDQYYNEVGDFKIGGMKYLRAREMMPEAFKNMSEGVQRIRNIVTELRDYAGGHPRASGSKIDLNQVVHSALILLSPHLRESTQQFTSKLGDVPLIIGSFGQLEQVVVNLVQNACHAVQKNKGPIHLETVFYPGSACVTLVVQDGGVGITPENLSRVTDPFFSTNRAEGGSGLGLAVVSRIVAEHGGRLEIDSQAGFGTTVKVSFNSVEEYLE